MGREAFHYQCHKSRSRPVTQARRVTRGRGRVWGLEKRARVQDKARRAAWVHTPGRAPCGHGQLDKGMSVQRTAQRREDHRRARVAVPMGVHSAAQLEHNNNNTARALARRCGCSAYRNRRRPPPSARLAVIPGGLGKLGSPCRLNHHGRGRAPSRAEMGIPGVRIPCPGGVHTDPYWGLGDLALGGRGRGRGQAPGAVGARRLRRAPGWIWAA